MYEKIDEKIIDNLFIDFEKPVKILQKTKRVKKEDTTIKKIIEKSIEIVIDDIANQIIKTKSTLFKSKNVKEIAKEIKYLFNESNLGVFEHTQKTGKNIFKIKHKMGVNGTEFLKKFFEKIFATYLKKYSMQIISNENHVCIMFR